MRPVAEPMPVTFEAAEKEPIFRGYRNTLEVLFELSKQIDHQNLRRWSPHLQCFSPRQLLE